MDDSPSYLGSFPRSRDFTRRRSEARGFGRAFFCVGVLFTSGKSSSSGRTSRLRRSSGGTPSPQLPGAGQRSRGRFIARLQSYAYTAPSGVPPQMPERALRLLPLERTDRLFAGRRWLSRASRCGPRSTLRPGRRRSNWHPGLMLACVWPRQSPRRASCGCLLVVTQDRCAGADYPAQVTGA